MMSIEYRKRTKKPLNSEIIGSLKDKPHRRKAPENVPGGYETLIMNGCEAEQQVAADYLDSEG